ncbi:MAG: hypothetical protein SF162_18925 [bacterium]|nr:hypothetical protein [bacterium]
MNRAYPLLLRACGAQSEAVRAAWSAWQASIDLDTLDGDSFHVLPLLYRRLEAAQVDDPLMPKLAGIARYHWVQAQIHGRAFADTLDLLQPFEPLIVYGAGLTDDLVNMGQQRRLWVRTGDSRRVLDALYAAGWKPRWHLTLSAEAQIIAKRLRHDRGYVLDVCWAANRAPAWNAAQWKAARTSDGRRWFSPLDAVVFAALDEAVHGADSLIPLAHLVEKIGQLGGLDFDAVQSRAAEWGAPQTLERSLALLANLQITPPFEDANIHQA